MTDTRSPPIDRRKPSSELLALVLEVRRHQVDLSKQIEDVPGAIAAAIAALMKEAFPEGDPEGHRRHHEAVLQAAEDKADFWKKMRLGISQWGVIGFLGWAAWNLWLGFLQGPHK